MGASYGTLTPVDPSQVVQSTTTTTTAPLTDPTKSTITYGVVDDAECANLTNEEIARGKFCAIVDSSNRLRYFPTEMWTGVVPTWGAVKQALTALANGSQRHTWFSYYTPSWYVYLGAARAYQVEQMDWSSMVGVADSFAPPVFQPAHDAPPPPAPKTYIVDPTTGIRYEIPPGANGDTPITPDGRTLNQLVYPSGAPDTPSTGFTPPDETAANGAPVAGPIAPPAGTSQVFIGSTSSGTTAGSPTPGTTPGYVKPLIDPKVLINQMAAVDAGLNATPTQTGSTDKSAIPWLLLAIGAAIVGLFVF